MHSALFILINIDLFCWICSVEIYLRASFHNRKLSVLTHGFGYFFTRIQEKTFSDKEKLELDSSYGGRLSPYVLLDGALYLFPCAPS